MTIRYNTNSNKKGKKITMVLILLLAMSCLKTSEVNFKVKKEKTIYKILTIEQWEKAQKSGSVSTTLDQNDGFIHLSTASQLAGTLHYFFENHEQLILLELKKEVFGNNLIFEAPKPKGDREGLFPHLYAELKLKQISKVWPISRGAFLLPEPVILEAEK